MEDRPRPAPRVRPALRRTAILACIVLLPLAARALWEHLEMRRLLGEVDAILARGEPVIAAGFSGTTEDHKQASRQYLAAAMLASDVSHAKRAASIDLAEWIDGGVPRQRTDAEVMAELGAIVERQADALRLADAANELEFKGFTPGNEFSYRTSALASLGRVLTSRTQYLAAGQKGDEAVRSALASLAFRRVGGDAPWFFTMTHPSDHETPTILSLSSPSAASLQELQAALENAEERFDPAQMLIEERARMLETIWRQTYGEPRAPRSYASRDSTPRAWLLRPWLAHRLAGDLRIWNEMIEASRKPWPDKVQATRAVQEKFAAAYQQGTGGQARFFPRFTGFVPEGLRTVHVERFVRDRASRVAVAVTRYRRAHAGALPSRLDDLVPGYLATVPQDPLSGGPMRFRSEAGAFTIYSAGVDGDDDGGDLASELRQTIQRGWGRRMIRGQDVGVRVMIR